MYTARYNPLIDVEAGEVSYKWKSTLDVVSIDDNTNKISRQITGSASSSKDADAVNVAQLKSLRDYVNKGWKLSVNGNNGKVVSIDGTVDFTAGSSNLNVTKGEEDNKVKLTSRRILRWMVQKQVKIL